MKYCLVESGVIVNIIVCNDDRLAESLGALSFYEGAIIGDTYNPPPLLPEPETTPEPSQLDRIEAQVTYTAMITNTLLEG